jgi:hypothetical protein
LIFRLQYQIASYTGYIGNLALSLKHETDQHYQWEHAGEKGICVGAYKGK